jgi:hypothetical protein
VDLPRPGVLIITPLITGTRTKEIIIMMAISTSHAGRVRRDGNSGMIAAGTTAGSGETITAGTAITEWPPVTLVGGKFYQQP